MRCDGAQPKCARCVRHDVECSYQPPQKKKQSKEDLQLALQTLNYRLFQTEAAVAQQNALQSIITSTSPTIFDNAMDKNWPDYVSAEPEGFNRTGSFPDMTNFAAGVDLFPDSIINGQDAPLKNLSSWNFPRPMSRIQTVPPQNPVTSTSTPAATTAFVPALENPARSPQNIASSTAKHTSSSKKIFLGDLSVDDLEKIDVDEVGHNLVDSGGQGFPVSKKTDWHGNSSNSSTSGSGHLRQNSYQDVIESSDNDESDAYQGPYHQSNFNRQSLQSVPRPVPQSPSSNQSQSFTHLLYSPNSSNSDRWTPSTLNYDNSHHTNNLNSTVGERDLKRRRRRSTSRRDGQQAMELNRDFYDNRDVREEFAVTRLTPEQQQKRATVNPSFSQTGGHTSPQASRRSPIGESVQLPSPEISVFGSPCTTKERRRVGNGLAFHNIVKLVGSENYAEWVRAVRAAARKEAVWDIMTGECSGPEALRSDATAAQHLAYQDDLAYFHNKNDLALGALEGSLEQNVQLFVDNYTSAREMWLKLEQDFKPKGDKLLFGQLCSLERLSLKTCGDVANIADGIKHFEKRISSIKGYERLPAWFFSFRFLSCLGPRYNNFVSNLLATHAFASSNSCSGRPLTFDQIVLMALEEEQRVN
ncbi:hypothetical protein B7494_g2489 [Chlorociboria aeruginascens]|nr:hypothetical protein B7494_g2489 [Chlorociboria aeruginascens]